MEPISTTSSIEMSPIALDSELSFPATTFLSKEKVAHSLNSKKIKVKNSHFFTNNCNKFSRILCLLQGFLMLIPGIISFVAIVSPNHIDKKQETYAAIYLPSIFVGLCCCFSGLPLLAYTLYKHFQRVGVQQTVATNSALDLEAQILTAEDSDKPLVALDFISLYQKGWIKDKYLPKLSFRQVCEIKQYDQATFNSIRDHLSSVQQTIWNKLDFLEDSRRETVLTTLNGTYFQEKLKEIEGLFEEVVHKLEPNLDHGEIKEALIKCAQSLLLDLSHVDFPQDQIGKIIDDVALGASLNQALENITLSEDDLMIKLSNGDEFSLIPKSTLLKTSEYFQGFFRMTPEKQEIKMNDITTTMFRILVHYLRHHQIKVDDENVENLVVIADHFQINELIKKCEQRLIRLRKDRSIEENLSFLEEHRCLQNDFFQFVDQQYSEKVTFPPLFAQPEVYQSQYNLIVELNLHRSREALNLRIESELDTYKISKDPTSFLKDMSLVNSTFPAPRIQTKIYSIFEKWLQTHPDKLVSLYAIAIENQNELVMQALINYSNNPENEEHIERKFPSKEVFISELKNQDEGSSERTYSARDSLL